MAPAITFSDQQLETVNNAVARAEEVVSEAFKMSASQWLRHRYDVRTRQHLADDELVDSPFAQVIRYRGQRLDTSLGSAAYDFYMICLQDHAILASLEQHPDLDLFAFVLYIVVHELIHIVRFGRFWQNYEASADEMLVEEGRVHRQTREIIRPLPEAGIQAVLGFFAHWHSPIDVMAR